VQSEKDCDNPHDDASHWAGNMPLSKKGDKDSEKSKDPKSDRQGK
jgi:hypothetical protein